MYEKIIKAASDSGCKFYENMDMSRKISFRVGGPAKLVVEPNGVDALSNILIACKSEGVKPIVLGNGTNVIVRDQGIDGVVILLGDDFAKIEYCGNNMVRAQAGANLSKLCKFALEYKLGGLEFAYGIPGTVGGAAFMNAGSYGGEMKDVIMVVDHMNLDGERGSFQGTELDFTYRHSAYVDSDLIITSVIFYLKNDNPDAIKNRMDNILARRKAKQPLEYPSAGSTFKRPEGFFAGALIEECGLKGKNIGGAEVSEKHAGFIINKGGAKASDILELIELIQKTVREEKSVTLEPEVRIIYKS